MEYYICHIIHHNPSISQGGVEAIDYKIVIGRLIFSEGHMWFLYMIIWLYLITPILRCFVNNANRNLAKYFIILGLVMFFTRPIIEIAEYHLPFNSSFLSILDNFHADFVGGFTIYYIAGWYLHNYSLSGKLNNTIYAVAIISIVAVIILINMFPQLVDTINSNENILIFFYSVGVFLLLQHIAFPRWVRNLSPYVFGVYIIHPVFIFLFNEIARYANSATISILEWSTVSLFSFLIVIMLSRAKYLHHLVKS